MPNNTNNIAYSSLELNMKLTSSSKSTLAVIYYGLYTSSKHQRRNIMLIWFTSVFPAQLAVCHCQGKCGQAQTYVGPCPYCKKGCKGQVYCCGPNMGPKSPAVAQKNFGMGLQSSKISFAHAKLPFINGVL